MLTVASRQLPLDVAALLGNPDPGSPLRTFMCTDGLFLNSKYCNFVKIIIEIFQIDTKENNFLSSYISLM